MKLRADFSFSQGSLQDYVACGRRFQLRYVRRLRWPAVEVAPALDSERHLQQGAAFHRLIHQHLLGLPVERLSATATDPQLRRWWRNYLESSPKGLPERRYPEVRLSAPLAGFRLTARYDLVAVEVGERAMIVDWKTNRKRPSRTHLSERLQSHVYPYLLVRAGGGLYGGEMIRPEQVTMVYWFANFPATPERFAYDDEQYRADQELLSDLIAEIAEVFGDPGDDPGDGPGEEALLPRTQDRRRCRYCRYRSLCRRGVEAGLRDEAPSEAMVEDEEDLELDLELTFDFQQVAEADHG